MSVTTDRSERGFEAGMDQAKLDNLTARLRALAKITSREYKHKNDEPLDSLISRLIDSIRDFNRSNPLETNLELENLDRELNPIENPNAHPRAEQVRDIISLTITRLEEKTKPKE